MKRARRRFEKDRTEAAGGETFDEDNDIPVEWEEKTEGGATDVAPKQQGGSDEGTASETAPAPAPIQSKIEDVDAINAGLKDSIALYNARLSEDGEWFTDGHILVRADQWKGQLPLAARRPSQKRMPNANIENVFKDAERSLEPVQYAGILGQDTKVPEVIFSNGKDRYVGVDARKLAYLRKKMRNTPTFLINWSKATKGEAIGPIVIQVDGETVGLLTTRRGSMSEADARQFFRTGQLKKSQPSTGVYEANPVVQAETPSEPQNGPQEPAPPPEAPAQAEEPAERPETATGTSETNKREIAAMQAENRLREVAQTVFSGETSLADARTRRDEFVAEARKGEYALREPYRKGLEALDEAIRSSDEYQQEKRAKEDQSFDSLPPSEQLRIRRERGEVFVTKEQAEAAPEELKRFVDAYRTGTQASPASVAFDTETSRADFGSQTKTNDRRSGQNLFTTRC